MLCPLSVSPVLRHLNDARAHVESGGHEPFDICDGAIKAAAMFGDFIVRFLVVRVERSSDSNAMLDEGFDQAFIKQSCISKDLDQ